MIYNQQKRPNSLKSYPAGQLAPWNLRKPPEAGSGGGVGIPKGIET